MPPVAAGLRRWASLPRWRVCLALKCINKQTSQRQQQQPQQQRRPQRRRRQRRPQQSTTAATTTTTTTTQPKPASEFKVSSLQSKRPQFAWGVPVGSDSQLDWAPLPVQRAPRVGTARRFHGTIGTNPKRMFETKTLMSGTMAMTSTRGRNRTNFPDNSELWSPAPKNRITICSSIYMHYVPHTVDSEFFSRVGSR